jgi:hypothetical protein
MGRRDERKRRSKHGNKERRKESNKTVNRNKE